MMMGPRPLQALLPLLNRTALTQPTNQLNQLWVYHGLSYYQSLRLAKALPLAKPNGQPAHNPPHSTQQVAEEGTDGLFVSMPRRTRGTNPNGTNGSSTGSSTGAVGVSLGGWGQHRGGGSKLVKTDGKPNVFELAGNQHKTLAKLMGFSMFNYEFLQGHATFLLKRSGSVTRRS